MISSYCYFYFRVSPFTFSHSIEVCVLMQLKVRGSSCCCHIYRNTEQMTHHANNLKILFCHRLFFRFDTCISSSFCHFPIAKLDMPVCHFICVTITNSIVAIRLFFHAQTFACTAFSVVVPRMNAPFCSKEGNVPYQYHSSK